ncbi:hypothetical protein GQ457_01G017130 [Hibiscus cannabinus]
MVEDVEDVLHLKNEGWDIEEATRKFDGEELAKKHKISMMLHMNNLSAHILLYVVGVFLYPNANMVPSLEHLKLLCSVGLSGKLNWCKYAYERVIDEITKMQNRVGLTHMTGYIAILEVQLFDYWSGIPSRSYASYDGHARIHAWGKKDVVKIVTT